MMKYTYPACKTVDKVEDWFGTQLPDPYAWLRDGKDPEVLDFVARENAYTDAWFDPAELEAKIAQLKSQKLPELPTGMIPWKGGYLASCHEEGIPQLQILDSKLQLKGLLPKPDLPVGSNVFRAFPCPKDETVLALSVLYPGAARPSILVCNIETMEILKEINGTFSFCWSKGDGCLYYSTSESDSEAQTCLSTFLRYDPATREEVVVYEDGSYAIFGQVYAAEDGSYVLATVCQDYAFARWVAIETATGKTHVLTEKPVEWHYIDTLEGSHYFVTLSEAAHGAVIRISNTGAVETVLPESEKRILSNGFSVGGKLFVFATEDVNGRLIAVEDGREVELPSRFGAVSQTGRGDGFVFLWFESFLDAPQILTFDGGTMTQVLSSSSASHPDLVVEQRFAPSMEDKTPIPYYLVRRKDAVQDGSAPALMYAYGGYNNNMPPWYTEMVTRTQVARWVEDGGIYVHCNLRGGSEYGPRWHEGGMGMSKRHCYEDFIGIAEQIIRDGWTAKGRIGISGCSNGGLLMSALVTMRPDLWGCVIDSVPHTDMIHFAEDDRGPMYITEYGNPRESQEMFQYLLSYSPYHNVRRVNYPPTYIQTGEMDNNVPPYHGKKFAARMQAENQSEHPILLRVLAEGSHDRGKGEVFWKTISEMHLFLEHALDLKKK